MDETIGRFAVKIQDYCRPFESAIERLDTIPGVARETAEVIVSEVGVDMNRFPTAIHLVSWAGVTPGNHKSAGKRLSGRTTKGNQALITALTQAAWATSHTKNTFLSAQYRRLPARRRHKKAIAAVAHSILIIAYHLIRDQETYQDLGSNYFDRKNSEVTRKRLMHRVEQLGYAITFDHLLPITA